jgi:DNA-binding transcriptional regulator YdaS (Cro superfamily)
MTLKQWFDATGKTQEWLAEATGIQQPLISKYARGWQRPQIDNAVAIEKATSGKVPVEAWVGWQPTTKPKRKRAA